MSPVGAIHLVVYVMKLTGASRKCQGGSNTRAVPGAPLLNVRLIVSAKTMSSWRQLLKQ